MQNALEIARLGRLNPSRSEPYEVVERDRHYSLRRYGGVEDRPESIASAPLLLVPPLMLTAEIYDVAPDVSAVGVLIGAGVDTWVLDFGAPEREEGGMNRTLDDHVKAVAAAVRRVREICGRDVHLGGYSQGGMFAYQAAAYLRSEGLASVITFGSPVDIHKNLPSVAADVAGRLIRGVQPMVELTLDSIEGLPAVLSSTGFKLLSPRKEIEQLFDFVRKLHDRQALERRESRRRFLGGEGFVAWPGPALRSFFDDIIVHNRMVAGGLVIDGSTVTMADITCPILYCVGVRDDFARPPSVRAIEDAAPNAACYEIPLRAGHFGLVVGSTSMRDTWPSVVDWVRWRDGAGDKPRMLCEPIKQEPWHDEPEELFEVDFDYELLTDEVAHAIKRGVDRVGEVYRDASDTVHGLRHQLPRLRRLERMTGSTRVSASLTLADKAKRMPDGTFFLWKGRAFSYSDADTRVTNVTRGLLHCGIRPGDRVGVLMGVRPSHLSVVSALNRIGAVAVMFSPALSDEGLAEAMRLEPLTALATDPEKMDRARAAYDGKVLVLGGGGDNRQLDAGVVDMEAIDPAAVEMPTWYRPDAGLARELAMILVRPGRQHAPKVSRISNGRWAFSALGVASAGTLTSADTVYCCLPLHHPSGVMVSVGGALVSGARLALSEGFDVGRFWGEVRRYGVTVVFYAGEMARLLVDAPPAHGERNHPVRLFAGSGMRADVWRRLRERHGVGVMEFYASTERNLVLANASGAKAGALGRRLPGSSELAIVEYDFEKDDFVRNHGRLRRCNDDEPGVAIVRMRGHVTGAPLLEDAFEPGDRWLTSGDVLRRDRDGDYWYVDRLSSMIRSQPAAVATPRIEDVLYELTEVKLAVVYGRPDGDDQVPVAVVMADEPLDPERFSERLVRLLQEHERPCEIMRVADIPLSEGFTPMKQLMRARDGAGVLQLLRYDVTERRYTNAPTDHAGAASQSS